MTKDRPTETTPRQLLADEAYRLIRGEVVRIAEDRNLDGGQVAAILREILSKWDCQSCSTWDGHSVKCPQWK